MSQPPSGGPPPLTIAGRSPLDSVRFRWGGGTTIVLGVILMINGGLGGIFFGIVLALLGVATWIFTRFGGLSWYELSPVGKGVAATGSIIGNVFLYTCFGIFFAIIWAIQLFT
jgi:hypothetical protein